MNMSIAEIEKFARLSTYPIKLVDVRYEDKLITYGTLEEQQKMQAKMFERCDIEYWLMDLITPDYKRLSEKVKGKNVLFDASNIFGYHMSHGNYTLDELVNSWDKLFEILGSAKQCWFQGTKPTKKWIRQWI